MQHIHKTRHGRCVPYREDYDQQHLVVGDLNQQSLGEVLTGDVMAMTRRSIHGFVLVP